MSQGNTGKYFFFSIEEFSNMVGNEDWDGKEFEIAQGGLHSWKGKVKVWKRRLGSYGRKANGYADGDWRVGDTIILKECSKHGKIHHICLGFFDYLIHSIFSN